VRTSTRMTFAAGWAAALGSIPLAAVYDTWSWLWYTWAAIAAVVAAHLAVRSTRLPALLAPIAGLLGLVIFVTLVFAGQDAIFGLIPTPTSMTTLADTVRDGLADVRNLAAPVPARSGLVLLTAGAVGLVTIVIDIIAVILRRPAAAGLALLGLYAVPTAVAENGVKWPLFVVGALGYLVLLMAEGRDRLLRWGRPVGGETAPPGTRKPDEETPLPLTGQRIGAAALAIAVIAPLFVPGLTGRTLSDLARTGGGDGTGGTGGQIAINPFTQLADRLKQPTPTRLFHASSDDANLYNFRLMTLDNYTSRGWDRQNLRNGTTAAGRLQAPDLQSDLTASETHYQLTITMDAVYNGDSLPSVFYPNHIEGVTSDWHYDTRGAILQNPTNRANSQRYTLQGYDAVPTEQQLQASTGEFPADVERRWGSSANIPDEVKQIVGTVIRGKNTYYEKARALNDFFRDGTQGFRYTTQTTPGNSGSVLVDFLEKKRGYCEQFASAMGIMLRVAGIPSRVVIGFLHTNNGSGEWDVSSSDAHAWVEGYFPGVGWAPFDPTPRAYDGRPDPGYAPGAVSPSAPPSNADTGSSGASPGGASGKLDTASPSDPGSGGTTSGGLITPRTALVSIGVLVVLAVLFTPLVSRVATRRRRLRTAVGADPRAAALASWDEVLASAVDYGLPIPANETPRGTARRLARDLTDSGPSVAGLRLLALAEERARYAPEAGVDGDLPTAVRAVRHGLRGLVRRRRRFRAAFFPPSTVQSIMLGLARRSGHASTSLGRLTDEVTRPFRFRRLRSRPDES
jgi:transglutaminase-like putative cysteine protease